MPEDLFATAWARLDRADKSRAQGAELWNEYLNTEPYYPALIREGDGVYILRIWEEEPPPLELGVVVGEWLYNLRSALDYLIWATAAHETGVIPPPDEGQTQYPIYDNEAEWKNNLYRLKHLAEHHREMLKIMQPFNSDPDANYLGWINRLARIDRHRHLSHMTGYLAVLNPVFGIPEGCTTTLQWGERLIRDGKADVARLVVTPWHEGMDVHMNPRMGIDPEIAAWSDSRFWKRINYSERFRMIQAFVSAEIATYGYDCTGSSRKADLLTDGYKEECDCVARPQSAIHIELHRMSCGRSRSRDGQRPTRNSTEQTSRRTDLARRLGRDASTRAVGRE